MHVYVFITLELEIKMKLLYILNMYVRGRQRENGATRPHTILELFITNGGGGAKKSKLYIKSN